MLIFAKTARWRTAGRWFFRRMRGVAKVTKQPSGYLVQKENGATATIPCDGTEIECGRKVAREG